MITRLGQAMPHFLVGANVAGEGLRERLRSTTFAFFGLVTATGLVLVGIAYNQGWPDFVNSPIPGIPIQRVGEARIAADAAQAIAHAGSAPASPRSGAGGQGPVSFPAGLPLTTSPPSNRRRWRCRVAMSAARLRRGTAGADAPAPPAPAPVAPPPQAAAQPPAAQPPPHSRRHRPRPGAGEGNSPGRDLAADLKGR